MVEGVQVHDSVPVARSVRTGALSVGAEKAYVLTDEDSLRYLGVADSVTVISPRVESGAHANLTVRLNDDPGKETLLLGGGNSVTLRGPVHSLRLIVRDNAVAGVGDDDVQVIFSGGVKGA